MDKILRGRTTIKLPIANFKLLSPPKPIEHVPGKYVAAFETPLDMNKIDIRSYLTELYGMNVEKVNTLIQVGKFKRSPAPRAWQKNAHYKRRDYKKAYVTFTDPSPSLPDEIVAYRKVVEDYWERSQETLRNRVQKK